MLWRQVLVIVLTITVAIAAMGQVFHAALVNATRGSIMVYDFNFMWLLLFLTLWCLTETIIEFKKGVK